jgi:hypothetical protein
MVRLSGGTGGNPVPARRESIVLTRRRQPNKLM